MTRPIYSTPAPLRPWLAIGLLVPVLSFAQAPGVDPGESDSTPSIDEAAGDDRERGGKATEAKAADKGRSPPNFTPSEEISEDLSVPFPVDI